MFPFYKCMNSKRDQEADLADCLSDLQIKVLAGG